MKIDVWWERCLSNIWSRLDVGTVLDRWGFDVDFSVVDLNEVFFFALVFVSSLRSAGEAFNHIDVGVDNQIRVSIWEEKIRAREMSIVLWFVSLICQWEHLRSIEQWKRWSDPIVLSRSHVVFTRIWIFISNGNRMEKFVCWLGVKTSVEESFPNVDIQLIVPWSKESMSTDLFHCAASNTNEPICLVCSPGRWMEVWPTGYGIPVK